MNNYFLRKNKKIKNLILLVSWSLVAVFLIFHHAMWRDEVRNFMLAIGTTSRLHLLGNPHPFLTYKIEQFFYWITESYCVLPISSFFISFLTVLIIIFLSPFNFKIKIMMAFGYPLLYEYTVMCRNYGMSALLMLALPLVMNNKKYKYILSGPILFFLANTNVHSSLIVLAFSCLWPLNAWYQNGKKWTDDTRKTVMNSMLGILGFCVCFGTIYPTRYDLAAVRPIKLAFNHDFYFFQHLTFYDFKDYIFSYLGHGPLSKSVYKILSIISYLSIALSTLMLWGDVFLFSVAILVMVGLSAFFYVVYPGEYRHQALWIMLVFALAWMKKNNGQAAHKKTINNIGLASFYTMLGIQCLLSLLLSFHELIEPNSRSKEFYAFMKMHDDIKESPMLSSLDYTLEAMPYYTKKSVFMMSLNDFDYVVPYRGVFNYNLDDLLTAAQKLAACSEYPPLILIVNDSNKTKKITSKITNIMDEDQEESVRHYMYNQWTFTITSEQKKRFLMNAHEIARYPNGYLEDGFVVYKLNVQNVPKTTCEKK